MAQPPIDVPRAERWFAVELNNLAWDLLDKKDRSADETERMIHAAHASVYHWLQAGNLLNHLRGVVLLANIYAGAGLGADSLRYALRALALSDEAGDSQSAFDRATALACAARAQLAAGNAAEAARSISLARQAAEKLDPEDRPVFEQLCPRD